MGKKAWRNLQAEPTRLQGEQFKTEESFMSKTSPFLKLTGKKHQSATHSLICRTRLRPESTAEDHGPFWWWPGVIQEIHSPSPPHKESSSNACSKQEVWLLAPIPSRDASGWSVLLRLNVANHCCAQGNTIFNYHLRVCKHHLRGDTTHSSAPVLSFPQVRSSACPHGREAHWPTSAATPLWSRALTCPRRTWLNSCGGTGARGRTSAGLCGTGLHPESTHCSEWGLQRRNQTVQCQLMLNFSFIPAPGKLTVSVLIVDA